MNSSLVITFNSPLINLDNFGIQDSNTPSVLMNFIYSEFGEGQTLPITGSILQDIKEAVDYININYNPTGRYSVLADYSNTSIEIIDLTGKSLFYGVFNNTGGRVSINVVNQPITPSIKINDVSISGIVGSECSLFNITTTTSIQATEITSPVIQSISTNPFTVTNISRDLVNDIVISVNDGNSNDTESIYVPPINSSFFSVEVVNSPSGGSVSIVPLNNRSPYFTLEYSFDGVNYSNTNTLSSVPQGSYTAYVRDSLGCETSFPFEVTDFEPNVTERSAYFKVSEQNSLISVKREDVDNITVFRNPTNTLSFEEETSINLRNFKQLYSITDGVITQQYRSNYDNVDVKIVNCEGVETLLTPIQKTNNFDVTDVRDISLIGVDYEGSEYVGIQYKTGNTYDPITLSIDGSYNLGSNKPDFMNIDDYIQVEGAGWFKVINVGYYEAIQTLILQSLVSSFPIPMNQTKRGTAIYDILPYEIYEVSFDTNTLNGDYYITYAATDSEYINVSERTEWFNVSDSQRNTYVLDYSNSVNNETNYATGIVNKIHLPYEVRLTLIPNDEQDVYLTDTNAVNIESSYRSFYSLELKNLPSNMVRKIGIILTNDRLFINGMSVLKNGEIEQERIGVTNTYKLTVQFVRSDYASVSNSSDGSIVLPNSNAIRLTGDNVGILLTK